MNKRQRKKYISKATSIFREAMETNYTGWYRKHSRSHRFTILLCDKEYAWSINTTRNLNTMALLYGVVPPTRQEDESIVEFKERIRRNVEFKENRRRR